MQKIQATRFSTNKIGAVRTLVLKIGLQVLKIGLLMYPLLVKLHNHQEKQLKNTGSICGLALTVVSGTVLASWRDALAEAQ